MNSNNNLNKQIFNPFTDVKCSETAREIFKNDEKKNSVKRINCPAKCKNQNNVIFGTFIYTYDSPVCKAAIHSGVISKHGGLVSIKLLSKFNFFNGSKLNDISSASISITTTGYTILKAPEVTPIKCDTSSINRMFDNKIGLKYIVNCPRNCSKKSNYVYGKDIYSGDSSICQSAIHSGQLNDNGGEVIFSFDKGLKNYESIKRNGITSRSRNQYLISFKIYSNIENINSKYKEEFRNIQINKNWKVVDDYDSKNYPSKWTYGKLNLSDGKMIPSICHKSKIKTNDLLGYGSILLLKRSNVFNFIYIISFYLTEIHPAGIIFKYVNEFNYYHIRFERIGKHKILLIKRFEGILIIIQAMTRF